MQTQVSKDYTFALGLRSTLRQDPDVIMVGEIRDAEVASTAVQASLTGHLVFSTLHTNDAAGTFPRLVDMGVSPDIMAAALTVCDGAAPRAPPVSELPHRSPDHRRRQSLRWTACCKTSRTPMSSRRTATRCGSPKAVRNAAASATRAASRSSRSSSWITTSKT